MQIRRDPITNSFSSQLRSSPFILIRIINHSFALRISKWLKIACWRKKWVSLPYTIWLKGKFRRRGRRCFASDKHRRDHEFFFFFISRFLAYPRKAWGCRKAHAIQVSKCLGSLAPLVSYQMSSHIVQFHRDAIPIRDCSKK